MNHISLIHHDPASQSESTKFFSPRGSVQNPTESHYLQESSGECKKLLDDEQEKLDANILIQNACNFNRSESVAISITRTDEPLVNENVANVDNSNTLMADQKLCGGTIDYKLKHYYQSKSELISQTLEKYKNQTQLKDQSYSPKFDYKAYIKSLSVEDIRDQNYSRKEIDSQKQDVFSSCQIDPLTKNHAVEKFESHGQNIQKQQINSEEIKELKEDQISNVQYSIVSDNNEDHKVDNSANIQESSLKSFKQQIQRFQEPENPHILKREEVEVLQEQSITNETMKHRSHSIANNLLGETCQDIEFKTGSDDLNEFSINVPNQESLSNHEQRDQNDIALIVAITKTDFEDDKALTQEIDFVEKEGALLEHSSEIEINKDCLQPKIVVESIKQVEKEKSNMTNVEDFLKNFEQYTSSNTEEESSKNLYTNNEEVEKTKNADKNQIGGQQGGEEDDQKRSVVIEKIENHKDNTMYFDLSQEYDDKKRIYLPASQLEAEEKTTKLMSPEKEKSNSFIYQSKHPTPEKINLSTEHRESHFLRGAMEESSSISQSFEQKEMNNIHLGPSNESPLKNELVPKDAHFEFDIEQPKETIMVSSDHNCIETETLDTHDTQSNSEKNDKKGDADSEIKKDQSNELEYEDNRSGLNETSLSENNLLTINFDKKHEINYCNEDENLQNQTQNKKDIQQESVSHQDQSLTDCRILLKSNEFEDQSAQRKIDEYLNSSKERLVESESEHIDVVAATHFTFAPSIEQEEFSMKQSTYEHTQITHSPQLDNHPPVIMLEESRNCSHVVDFQNDAYASNKYSQPSSIQKIREREKSNSSPRSSPQRLTETGIKLITSDYMNSESRDEPKNKIKSPSKSPEKHENSDTPIQESFHKFYEQKEKENMHQISSFDERMRTDIELRKEQEKA